MKTETRMFFDAILRENRPIGDFIDGATRSSNERLAKHYGIEGVTGPQFRRVELTTPERGGVLGQGHDPAAVLALDPSMRADPGATIPGSTSMMPSRPSISAAPS